MLGKSEKLARAQCRRGRAGVGVIHERVGAGASWPRRVDVGMRMWVGWSRRVGARVVNILSYSR